MEGLASRRLHCGIKLQLLEYGQNILHTLSRQSAQIPWAQTRRVGDWRDGCSHHCIGCLPRAVKVGGVNLRDRILSQPSRRLFGFPQTLLVKRDIHPTAQSLCVIQRVKHSFPVAH